jgi:sugar/nucleoside kinase (ribokinase family)
MKPLDLFCIGAWTIFDHIFRLAQYPREGQTVRLDMPINRLHQVYFGDCSANVAAAAARLGMRTGLGMVVGDDFVTSGYQAHLEELGVDLSGVEIRPGEQSGHSYLYGTSDGDGFCISHLGLAEQQANWAVPGEQLRSARTVVVNELFGDYTLKAIQVAKAAGALTVINGMIGTAGDMAPSFLAHADVLVIAASEASDLLNVLGLQSIPQLQALGPQRIFLTRGSSGSLVYVGSNSFTVPSVPARVVVDTTGAGDSYVAGVVSGLLQGVPEAEAAHMGAAVASYVVEEWGCQTNLPDAAAVAARMAPQNQDIDR